MSGRRKKRFRAASASVPVGSWITFTPRRVPHSASAFASFSGSQWHLEVDLVVASFPLGNGSSWNRAVCARVCVDVNFVQVR